MKITLLVFVCAVSICAADYSHGSGYQQKMYHQQEQDKHGYGTYKFGYEVDDDHTSNHQSRHESKDNHGTIRGTYKVQEADGNLRVVDYVADKHKGFMAYVNGVPHF